MRKPTIMKTMLAGVLLVAGVLWMSACAPVGPAAGGGVPSKRGGPGLLHKGGMLDDELNYGRSYQ
jgi:hypothetical protein